MAQTNQNNKSAFPENLNIYNNNMTKIVIAKKTFF